MGSKPYRLKKGTISRPEPGGRKLYVPGDVVQMSDEQLAAFNGVLEPVHSAPAPGKAEKSEKPKLATELIEEIANSDCVDEVTAILDAEADGPKRVSVLEAANAKLEALKLDTEDDEKEE